MKENILEQIFDVGYAVKEIILGEKIPVIIKSLSAKDYLDIDPILSKKGTKLFVLQSYGIAKLAKALVEYNTKRFDTFKESMEYLENLPASIIDKLLEEQIAFEKAVKEALSPENIEESFFDKAGSI